MIVVAQRSGNHLGIRKHLALQPGLSFKGEDLEQVVVYRAGDVATYRPSLQNQVHEALFLILFAKIIKRMQRMGITKASIAQRVPAQRVIVVGFGLVEQQRKVHAAKIVIACEHAQLLVERQLHGICLHHAVADDAQGQRHLASLEVGIGGSV